ncbi:hypothetical protein CYMTET_31627 [Cymbomonas tetramitiformis]|uniref:Uncharacterized protein n=1 Tax=Cymbomonas tetramitiformis TaxID=36881 RepID=A0AAE0FHI1_9CHLO|nr:hypothetical protein CYMTET_31627 [Cymbomonas tetramitiformis]
MGSRAPADGEAYGRVTRAEHPLEVPHAAAQEADLRTRWKKLQLHSRTYAKQARRRCPSSRTSGASTTL